MTTKKTKPGQRRKPGKRPGMVRETPAPYGKQTLKSVSLFSGGGGIDIGVENAGFHSLAGVEFDHNAADTLRFNAERKGTDTKIIEADIQTVDPLALADPGIDLLHGGPPCQAFSLIGKRGSLCDERGMLLFEMIRFARALRPRALLLEQAKGLLSAPNEKGEPGGVFKRFTRQLEEIGYCVKWTVLCAADYGVPQLRERVFIVATHGRNGFSFPPPTHTESPEDTPLLPLKSYVGIGSVIGDLPKPAPKGTTPTVPNHVDVTPDRDRERIHPVAEGGFLAGTANASPDLKRNLTKKDTTKYRRLHRLEPSLTLRCGEIFFHPIEDRYLTPREYIRIHGYPDSHILCGFRDSCFPSYCVGRN
ncbi:MAG: DNA cytosine methyltransferase [Verrucomicrobiota bacterium]|nr:DNA cytosine methyltransferase [Verrucomicrobiota bacterium]